MVSNHQYKSQDFEDFVLGKFNILNFYIYNFFTDYIHNCFLWAFLDCENLLSCELVCKVIVAYLFEILGLRFTRGCASKVNYFLFVRDRIGFNIEWRGFEIHQISKNLLIWQEVELSYAILIKVSNDNTWFDSCFIG